MPAKSNVVASSKPKRSTRKPATYVPGATSTPTKSTTPTTSRSKRSVPTRSPKKAPTKVPTKHIEKKSTPTKRVVRPKRTVRKVTPKKTKTSTVKSTKKPATRAVRGVHPTYDDMIVEAIKSLRKKNGSSRQAISAYIINNYKVPEASAYRFIKQGIKKLSDSGKIEKIRASFRMTPKPKTLTKSPAKKIVKKTKKAAAKSVAKAAKTVKTKATKKPATSISKKSATETTSTTTTSVSSLSDTNAPLEAGTVVWQYHHGTWQNYDSEASAIVEEQYQDWLKNNQMFDVRSVKSGVWEYNVDFRNMQQQNIQHSSHTKRNIRRYIVPSN